MSQAFLHFDDLGGFKKYGRVLGRLSFIWDLPDGFLMLRVRGGKSPDIKCPSQHIGSSVPATNMIYHWSVGPDDPAEVYLSGFSTIKLLSSPHFYTIYSLEGRHQVWPSIMNGEIRSTFLRAYCLYRLFGILL